jgi:hypothetical protein
VRLAGADPALTIIARKGDREIRWACIDRTEHSVRRSHFERDGYSVL